MSCRVRETDLRRPLRRAKLPLCPQSHPAFCSLTEYDGIRPQFRLQMSRNQTTEGTERRVRRQTRCDVTEVRISPDVARETKIAHRQTRWDKFGGLVPTTTVSSSPRSFRNSISRANCNAWPPPAEPSNATSSFCGPLGMLS